jgi:transcriptional regulator with XRE-family HTH domain
MRNPTQRRDAQRLFASNMRRIRREKGLTQEVVAGLAELHPNYVSSVERGERNISINSIEKIAFALGVGMDALVADPMTPAKPAIGGGSAPQVIPSVHSALRTGTSRFETVPLVGSAVVPARYWSALE